MTTGGKMIDKFLLDGQKLEFHPDRVAQIIAGRNDWEKTKDIYPIYVEISPIGGCPHQCTHCGVDYVIDANKKSGVIPQLNADMLVARLHEMGELGIKSVMFAGAGEPLLHKRINAISQTANLAGIDTAFTTNGVLLDKLDLSGVSWVKVSINGGTKESYTQVHRTKSSDFDRVIANVRDAVRRKGSCTIGIQMVLLPENQDTIEELKAIGKDLGVDYVVIKPFSQHRFSLNRQYEKYDPRAIPIAEAENVVVRRESMNAAVTTIPYSKCLATPYTWAYIEADGDVYGCSAYLKDNRFNYGNLNKSTFKQIWQSEKRRVNWEYVRNHLDISECRLACRMHASNMYLHRLIQGTPHVNFI